MGSLIQSLKRGSKIGEELLFRPLEVVIEVRIFQLIMEILYRKDGSLKFPLSYGIEVKNNQMNLTMRLKTIFLNMRTKSWLIAPLRLEFMERSRTIGLP